MEKIKRGEMLGYESSSKIYVGLFKQEFQLSKGPIKTYTCLHLKDINGEDHDDQIDILARLIGLIHNKIKGESI